MQLNKVHNIDFLKNDLPDKCAKLIIADPPYYKVKGDFDFVWKTFDDYLKDVEKWAIECKRILADNGTLFWYGSAKNIAYAQIIFDKHFNLINNLVWNKGAFLGLENSEGLRSFAPCTERILFYSNEIERTGLEEIKLNVNNFKPLRGYFEYVQKSLKLPKKAFLEKVGQCADHCFRWGSTQWDLPTKSTYDQLIEAFRIDLLKGFKTYEELRHTYEELRRPFNNRFNLQEVLKFSNEATKTGSKHDHDTVKPEKLTRALILTCSRKDDLVVVPFSGSGTECAMAAKEGRPFIGYEITEKHAIMSQERANNILRQPKLF
jgi:site-specific DNA-methyltransferase (adenine-specific)